MSARERSERLRERVRVACRPASAASPPVRRLTPTDPADPHPPLRGTFSQWEKEMRAKPATAASYSAEKSRCAALHPQDSAAYAACKTAWTDRAAAEAVH